MNEGWGAVIEAALGIAVGASCTAMVMTSPLPPTRAVSTPHRLCPPEHSASAPRLDGDVLALPDAPRLICNGFAGRWESETERRHRLAQRRSLNKGWRGA